MSRRRNSGSGRERRGAGEGRRIMEEDRRVGGVKGMAPTVLTAKRRDNILLPEFLASGAEDECRVGIFPNCRKLTARSAAVETTSLARLEHADGCPIRAADCRRAEGVFASA